MLRATAGCVRFLPLVCPPECGWLPRFLCRPPDVSVCREAGRLLPPPGLAQPAAAWHVRGGEACCLGLLPPPFLLPLRPAPQTAGTACLLLLLLTRGSKPRLLLPLLLPPPPSASTSIPPSFVLAPGGVSAAHTPPPPPICHATHHHPLLSFPPSPLNRSSVASLIHPLTVRRAHRHLLLPSPLVYTTHPPKRNPGEAPLCLLLLPPPSSPPLPLLPPLLLCSAQLVSR